MKIHTVVFKLFRTDR